MILVAGSGPRRRTVCPLTGRIGKRRASRRADHAPAARTTRSAAEPRPVGEHDAAARRARRRRRRDGSAGPTAATSASTVRRGSTWASSGQVDAADAVRRHAGLERADRRPVEPLPIRRIPRRRAVGRPALRRVGEHERAAARVGGIDGGELPQLVGEARPQLGRPSCERSEARRLGIRREDTRGGVRGAGAGKAPLDHADIEAALLRAPGGGRPITPPPTTTASNRSTPGTIGTAAADGAQGVHAPRWVNHLPSSAVVEDDGVLACLEHDLEVAPDDGLLRPPAVEHAPFLAEDGHRLVVHLPRRPVDVRLDPRRTRLVQSSRGTKSARVSGMRDHGATSTTVQTEPEPVLARTWRSPSLSRLRSSAPAASSSS